MDETSRISSVEQEKTDIMLALSSISSYNLSDQKVTLPGTKATPPTWNMFDFFAKAFLQFVMTLETDQSSEFVRFHQYFSKFRDIAFTRFCTSSEEKGTIDSYHSKIFQREEKESNLNAKCLELKTILNQLQVENRDNELTLRGKKEQSAEEVRSLLDEYNQDIQSRIEELQRLHEDHERTQSKLSVYQTYFRNKELEEARRQEQERLKIEAIQAKLKRKIDAVIFIQYIWRRHLRRIRAKEALENKDKGKKEEKGKKKSKGAKSSKKSSKGPKVKKTVKKKK